MESNSGSEVTISSTSEQCSETTVEIKIKTLDSQTYTLRVDKSMPVPALKEQIANVTGVLSEQQRLICRGKVLKDDQLLSAYHVEDGHTLHLVVRQPSSSSTISSVEPDNAPTHPATNLASSTTRNNGSVGHNLVFGTVNLADQGDPATSEFGRSSERPERASGNIGVSDPAQTQPNQSTVGAEYNQQQSAFRSPSAGSLGAVIPDSLATLFEYLSYLRNELNVNGIGNSSNAEAGYRRYGEGQGHNAQPHAPVGQGGLPTPASLAEVLLSARQLLLEQAGGCLSELARQLEDQASVTDPLARTTIQSNAMRSGVLFQNLGSLLLELGRTTMTLRMGQIPSEAVVNAGPAIFISSSGPNPLMVQAGTSFGGIPMGTVHPGHGLAGGTLGSGFLSRNIDIRIRRGHSVPVATANLGDQAGVQQPSVRTDPTRSSSENLVHQAFQGVSAGASISGEPGVRVVPIRTVVAVPAGVSRPPSDSSSSAVGLLYPLLARFQQQSPGNLNDPRSVEASVGPHSTGTETGQQHIPDPAPGSSVISPPTNGSSQHQQETSGVSDSSRQGPLDDRNSNGTQAHEGQQNGQDSLAQMFGRFGQMLRTIFPGEQIQIGDISLQGTSTDSAADQTGATADAEAQVGNDDGVFFSDLVRQLMPFISQRMTDTPDVSPGDPSSSAGQTESRNSTDARSSDYRRDPPEAPDSKRPKRE